MIGAEEAKNEGLNLDEEKHQRFIETMKESMNKLRSSLQVSSTESNNEVRLIDTEKKKPEE